MRLTLGYDYFDAKKHVSTPVVLDTQRLINAHMLLLGASGTGKSYTLCRLIHEAQQQHASVRFHVFDVHGDLDIPGADEAVYSEQSLFGLNPLKVNPDPDFGGVRKAIQSFIRTINLASTTPLGLKQESVLRNLMLDVYKEFGFYANNPESWSLNELGTQLLSSGHDNRLYLEVPFEQKDKASALGARWDPQRKSWWVHTQRYEGDLKQWKPAFRARKYPSIADLTRYATLVHEERFMGSDQEAVRALEMLNRKARALHKKRLDRLKDSRLTGGGYDAEEEAELDKYRESAIEAYQAYVNRIQTGHELENLMKYDSPEVLKSVLDRLNNLKATGLFKADSASFDPKATVWRYKLNALSMEEKKMFVLFILQELFTKAIERGVQSDVVEVIVLDELGTYTNSDDDSGDGIIGVIARQARKFGMSLWAADQQPTGVPESLISSCGTKVILGIDERYWSQSVTKLRMDMKLLEWIQPMRTLGVQLKEKGSLRNRWRWTQLSV